jgi:hypothetical protein
VRIDGRRLLLIGGLVRFCVWICGGDGLSLKLEGVDVVWLENGCFAAVRLVRLGLAFQMLCAAALASRLVCGPGLV